MIAGLFLAVLAGYGMQRFSANRETAGRVMSPLAGAADPH